jgi:Zn-dependent protease
MEILFLIAILIMSIVVHEVSHGYMADYLGDPTARLAGRLTLNPISHIDLLGSIIIPGLLLFTQSPFLFGWAKPVPYNAYNLSNQRYGEAIVAGAGPAVNVAIALLFGLIVRFSGPLGLPETFTAVATVVVLINVVLAVINMLPIPPIDGSKVLRQVLPYHLGERFFQPIENLTYQLGPFAIILVLLLIVFVLGPILTSIIFWLVGLFTGLEPVAISQALSAVLQPTL